MHQYIFDKQNKLFRKIFHYEDEDLSLITEFRESIILKEFHFKPHFMTQRFINYLFGDNFLTNEEYITEIRYNESKSPVFYEFRSKRDEYIGHIILNYNRYNNQVRESWFQGNRKIIEF